MGISRTYRSGLTRGRQPPCIPMGGRAGKTKTCNHMSTICGHSDAQIPAIIVISAVQTAIKYIRGNKIMMRDQITHQSSLKGRL